MNSNQEIPITEENILDPKNNQGNHFHVRTISYGRILYDHSLSYHEDGIFLKVGEPKSSQGWIIHISIITSQTVELLEQILPILISSKAAFQIIKDNNYHNALNGGMYGVFKIGKVISIFPDNDLHARQIVDSLKSISLKFKGPKILSDFHLGGIVYTRYGSTANGVGDQIQDGNGTFIEDNYYVPCWTPDGISNPFTDLVIPVVLNNKRILKNKFLIKNVLSQTIKGNVLKGYYLNLLSLKPCIIKQGRENIISDVAGRDMKDRLLWQQYLQNNLYPHHIVPKALDYFEIDGDGYLAMEFIKGLPLNQKVQTILKNRPCWSLPKEQLLALLSLIKKVVDAIDIMHQQHLIHRDIAASNFIVLKDDSIRMIDLELAYSKELDFPTPAFTIGTKGYMSPEQYRLSKPDYPTDIYSLGALMILVFTGLEPAFIVEDDLSQVQQKLRFLIRNECLSDLILSCLANDPGKRISLHKLKTGLRAFTEEIGISGFHISESAETSDLQLKEVIQQGINALGSDSFLADGYWKSEYSEQGATEIHASFNTRTFVGIHKGLAGVIYLLARAKSSKIDLTSVNAVLAKSIGYINDFCLSNHQGIQPGLHFGSAGLILSLVSASDMKLEGAQVIHLENLVNGFYAQPIGLDLISGASGQGMAMLICRKHIPQEAILEVTTKINQAILSSQLPDGSWDIKLHPNKKPEKNTSFGYGIAGIVYYLLHHACFFPDGSEIEAAKRGLNYLLQVRHEDGPNIQWNHSLQDKFDGGWWCNGTPGVALVFLKGYEVFGHELYKSTAIKALRSLPEEYIHYNLSQCHGMAGLGEIYLEAYRVLGMTEWLQRATWIKEYLVTHTMKTKDGNLAWLVENSQFPTADLLVGMGGVLHFLLRYRNPELGFPLLSNNPLL